MESVPTDNSSCSSTLTSTQGSRIRQERSQRQPRPSIWCCPTPFPSSNGAQGNSELGSQCCLAHIRLQAISSKGFREGAWVVYPSGRNHPYGPGKKGAEGSPSAKPFDDPKDPLARLPAAKIREINRFLGDTPGDMGQHLLPRLAIFLDMVLLEKISAKAQFLTAREVRVRVFHIT